MKILLVSNRYKETTAQAAQESISWLNNMGVQVELDTGNEAAVHPDGIDLVIVFGGDGTILRAARRYAILGVPVLGVNMGKVGFLSNIEVDELEQFLPHLLDKRYRLDQRMMLEVSIQRDGKTVDQGCCLNEMVIKSAHPHLITLALHIGNDVAGKYRGDGLIVATPTGSTAYSLSCGGPVADPDLDMMVVTPIASQIISRKPMVVAGDKEITLYPLEMHDALVCLDGQVHIPVEQKDSILIRRAAHKLNLVNLHTTSFFHGIDSRLRRSESLL